MTRYVTHRSRAYYDDGQDIVHGERVTLIVVEPTDEPKSTGLLDRHGNPLMREAKSGRPIGFGHVYEDER